jgi:tetratricopeptide (TPR) repeat protein
MSGTPQHRQVDRDTDLRRLLCRARRAHERGESDKAVQNYTALLQHDPGNFDALHGLGQIHVQGGRLDMALALFQSALQSNPERADGFSSLGLCFHLLRQFERAERSYDAGLRIEPGHVELLNRRGVARLELGRPQRALDDFDGVLTAQPGHFEALGNRGNALLKLNRAADALAAYDLALRQAPDNVQLLTNRAVALRRLDRPQEAVMSARRARKRKPDFAQARFVESVARLTLGDFGAWRDYEARWSVGLLASQRRNFTAPLWLGDAPLDGKTILLHAEQGSGDTLQFVRYAPLFAGQGASVILEVQPEIKRLLAALPGVAAVIARGETLPPFDLHCPLLSLPAAFGTELATIPADIPYLAAAPDDIAVWRARLPQQRPLVGLVWAGGRVHDNDANRSMRLSALAPLLELPDISFVSLQHEVREEDVSFLNAQTRLFRFEQKFRDFADTAAVIASLDAVVAVDTAVAHLAGAMGKPLFLLLPLAADFRWMRERHDTPWYPTARLYRQSAFGDWNNAVGRLCDNLIYADWMPRVRLNRVETS